MSFLKDLPVLVLGLGASGLAMARWCARQGADVTVWDSRENPPQAAALQAGDTAAVQAQRQRVDQRRTRPRQTQREARPLVQQLCERAAVGAGDG